MVYKKMLTSFNKESMTTPRLNVDVLAIVSDFIANVSDVLSFSLLCSSIRPIATRRLLSMRPIALTEYNTVKKLHTFLFADAFTRRARAPHIVALHIESPDIDIDQDEDSPQIANQEPSFASLLVDIINSCPQLRHVSMESFEDNYTDGRSIVVAIAALQNLRSLTITGDGWSTHSLYLVREASSHIRKLVFHSTYVGYPIMLEEFLPHLAPTLQELELICFRVLPVHDIVSLMDDAHPFLDRMQYPTIRSLSVYRFRGPPLLDRLRYLFPAIDGTLDLGVFDTHSNRHPYDDIRAANQCAQEGSPPHSWKKLDWLICDPLMLYVLALRCPIRLIMLDEGSADALHYATDALRDNPVPRLKLTLKYERSMLQGIFSPELAGTLSHLTLCLVYDNDSRSMSRAYTDDFAQLSWDNFLVRGSTATSGYANVCSPCVVLVPYRIPSFLPFSRCAASPTFVFSSTPESTVPHHPRPLPTRKAFWTPSAGRRSTSNAPPPRLPVHFHLCGMSSSRPAGTLPPTTGPCSPVCTSGGRSPAPGVSLASLVRTGCKTPRKAQPLWSWTGKSPRPSLGTRS